MGWGWRQNICTFVATPIMLVGAGSLVLAAAASPAAVTLQTPRRLEVRQSHQLQQGIILATEESADSANLPEAPSPWWLIVMPAIPLVGGGFIYFKRRWLTPVPNPLKGASPAYSLDADTEVPATSSEPNITESPETEASISVSDRAIPSQRSVSPTIAAIAGYFPLIGIASVTLAAFGAYIGMRSQLVLPVRRDLDAVADAQETELDTWFHQQRQALLSVNTLPETLPDVEKLLVPGEITAEAEVLYQAFDQYIHALPAFQNTHVDIALLTNGGIVTYATDAQREGQYQPLQNTTTYITRETTDTLPNLYVSPLTDELQITFATPILSTQGERLGVFAVDLDLAQLAENIGQMRGVDTESIVENADSHEIYLVGRASLVKNQIVSADQDFRAKYRDGVTSYGIQQATSRMNGSGLYLNYAKVPVIGVYRWAPRHNLALLVEVEQAEIFQPAQRLVRQILGIGFISTGILTLLLARYAKNLPKTETTPIESDASSPPWSPGARE